MPFIIAFAPLTADRALVCRLEVIDQVAPHGPTPCQHAPQWGVDQAVQLTTTPARPREARVHRCVPVLWPDAATRWATADRGGCFIRQGLSPELMPLPGLAPVSPSFGLRPVGRLSLP